MKKILLALLIVFSVNSLSFAQIEKQILGSWEVVKFENDTATIYPDTTLYYINNPDADRNRALYYLNVEEDRMYFNMGVNSCEIHWEIIDGDIKTSGYMCTEICCDDYKGGFYKYLHYYGKFTVDDTGNNLMVENEKGRLYLKRKEK